VPALSDPFQPSHILMYSPIAQDAAQDGLVASQPLPCPGEQQADAAQQNAPLPSHAPVFEVEIPAMPEEISGLTGQACSIPQIAGLAARAQPGHQVNAGPLQDIANVRPGARTRGLGAAAQDLLQTPPSVSVGAGQKRRRASILSPSSKSGSGRAIKRLMCDPALPCASLC
jgi:hypothetical protein